MAGVGEAGGAVAAGGPERAQAFLGRKVWLRRDSQPEPSLFFFFFFDLGSLGFLPIRWFQKLQVFLFVSLFVLMGEGGGISFFSSKQFFLV